MSKLFFDHLVVIEEIDYLIKNAAETPEEKEELWKLVDEIIHTRIMELIFDRLPKEFHSEFLEKFTSYPHDENHINYLNEKITDNIEKLIKDEVDKFKGEILTLVEVNIKV